MATVLDGTRVRQPSAKKRRRDAVRAAIAEADWRDCEGGDLMAGRICSHQEAAAWVNGTRGPISGLRSGRSGTGGPCCLIDEERLKLV